MEKRIEFEIMLPYDSLSLISAEEKFEISSVTSIESQTSEILLDDAKFIEPVSAVIIASVLFLVNKLVDKLIPTYGVLLDATSEKVKISVISKISPGTLVIKDKNGVQVIKSDNTDEKTILNLLVSLFEKYILK